MKDGAEADSATHPLLRHSIVVFRQSFASNPPVLLLSALLFTALLLLYFLSQHFPAPRPPPSPSLQSPSAPSFSPSLLSLSLSPVSSPPRDAPWSPSSPFVGCSWRFVKYRPSAWEREWTSAISTRQYHVCPLLQDEEERRRAVHTLHLIHRMMSGSSAALLDVAAFKALRDVGVFSEMQYEWACEGQRRNSTLRAVQVIEPLIGLLRDPFTMCFGFNDTLRGLELADAMGLPIASDILSDPVQSKRMVLLGHHAQHVVYSRTPSPSPLDASLLEQQPQWLSSLHQPLFVYHRGAPLPPGDGFSAGLDPGDRPRRILFDLGASYYGGWLGHSTAVATSWFVDGVGAVRPAFDRIVAFEYEVLPPARVWGQIPMHIMPYYTFINVPCTADPASPHNPWNLLVQMARPQDFVLVKLDIDTPSIEGPLMAQILRNQSISSRIDEMAYEHHVYVPEMESSWRLGPKHPEHLMHSYQLFSELRRLGIRMHSWP